MYVRLMRTEGWVASPWVFDRGEDVINHSTAGPQACPPVAVAESRALQRGEYESMYVCLCVYVCMCI